MTTKSTVAQMIVANHCQQVSGDRETEGRPFAPPEARQTESEPVKGQPIGEKTKIRFDSKEEADKFREETPHLVDDEEDDTRLKTVAVHAETPRELLEENRRAKEGFPAEVDEADAKD